MPVTVNGVEITDAAIHAEMQHHPAPSREIAEHSATLALVAKELLLQEAARLDIADADEDARIAALIERELQTPEPNEENCRRFFTANRQRFRDGDLFEVSHILCAAPPNDAGARAEARARAESAIARLDGPGGNFAELAAQLSDCPSKRAGGSLGQIGLAQTVPEFEQALFAMREGETSRQPVESRFGFHVIQLHRRTEGRPLDYDRVRDRIARYLCEQEQRQAISRYLSLLISRADIGGIDLLGVGEG
ncbi:MAG: parvulin peptidyl-prolyl isomerase [Candidatus Contendobacter sp.]|nr:MAG: parvulin peptidyl-prolyl isomerase [Candidatus Contendobacter sp.]